MNGELGVTPTLENPREAWLSSAPSELAALVAQSALSPGDLIADKYKVERVRGAGGMGIVLRALHVELNRPVAIKVVRGEFLQNEEIVARTLSEAQLAASIRSEHVARVLDLGRLRSGAPYIVFEYLEGQDLARLLAQRGALPHEAAVHIVLQVCDALAEAHAAGIVHRDLKPENLFLAESADGTPVVKVLDFGVSKKLSQRDGRAALTGPLQVIGSPYYMAPEQMRSGQIVDARADVWALGVVLFELYTGQTPFSADSVPAVCAMVLDDNPVPPSAIVPELPRGLERIILRCLRKQPERRYQNVAELAEALTQFGPEQAREYAERTGRIIDKSRRARLNGSGLEQWATQRSVGAWPAQARSSPPRDVQARRASLSQDATLQAGRRAGSRATADLRQAVLVVATAAGISMLASIALHELRSRSSKPVLSAQVEGGVSEPPARPTPEPRPPDVNALAPATEWPLGGTWSSASAPAPATAGERATCADRPRVRALSAGAAPRAAAAKLEETSAEPSELDAFDPNNFGGRQ